MDFQNENITNENKTEKEINEIINQLTKDKERFASEGRYLEAEDLKNRINGLKDNQTGLKKKDLTYQHASEMKNLEHNYNKEINEINQKWENYFNDFNEKAKKLDDENTFKHKSEMEEYISYLELKLPKQVKYSKEYLDLKQSEFNLVKQERYVEAHFIKSKCELMEKTEFEKHNKERNDKFKIKTDQFVHKQNLERSAMKQKLDTEYDLMKQQKEDETEKLVHKFKNKKTELDSQQKLEKNLNENENMLKAKNSSNKLSMTQRNFSKISPHKFKLYPSELKLKEMSRSMKKTQDESNYNYVSNVGSPHLMDNYSQGNPRSDRSNDIVVNVGENNQRLNRKLSNQLQFNNGDDADDRISNDDEIQNAV